jgi:D-xylose 1-dehydrogenase (NADP+, D-xylono-1,5-lactone-forming)
MSFHMNTGKRLTEPVVRFGLIGVGRIATACVAPAIHNTKRATLQAAASRDAARAASVGAASVYDSYDALLRDPKVDAVYIATHNGLHKPLALEALRSGKHVFCEKPLALSAKECEAIIAAAEVNNRCLVEGFMYRYHPQIAEVQRLIDAGVIGELKTVETSFRFPLINSADVRLRPEFGGGALLDVGCYCISASRLFLGEDLQKVSALPVVDAIHGIDTSVQGVLQFSGGRIAVVSCGFDSGLHQRLTLAGTRGVITLNEPFTNWTGAPRLTLQVGRREKVTNMPTVNTFEAELEDFVAAILDGRSALLSPQEGLLNARILDRVAAEMRSFR